MPRHATDRDPDWFALLTARHRRWNRSNPEHRRETEEQAFMGDPGEVVKFGADVATLFPRILLKRDFCRIATIPLQT